MTRVRLIFAAFAVLAVGATSWCAAQTVLPDPVVTVPGMPPVPDPANLYSEIGPDRVSPALKNDLPRIYVPNRRG